MTPDYQSVDSALARLGLMARGGFALKPGELSEFGLASGHRSLLMVGNAGPALWGTLSLVLTYDQEPNPLDRWTERVLTPLARQFSAVAVYPFGGPPYLPFQRWAQRAEPVFPSPIGPLIHPEYGLWHAYRGALLFEQELEFPVAGEGGDSVQSPCDACAAKPCLNTCPVGAFAPGAYDVPACVDHIAAPVGEDCLGTGCRARRACPVGQAYVYPPMQARFHMEAFLAARQKG